MRNRIKKDSLLARKAGEKEKALALTTLIAEIERSNPEIINGEKVWTDAQCISAIKKTMDGNELCGNYIENELLSIYLPKMMSNEELSTLIENHIKEKNFSGMKDMSKVMDFLKQFAGKYDGKDASDIVKKQLSNKVSPNLDNVIADTMLKQGTKIKFNSASPIEGTGKIVGVATNAMTFIGRSYIIEPDKPISNETYPYTHCVLYETMFDVIK
jgi:hypothetical protein